MSCTGNGECFYQIDLGYGQNACDRGCQIVHCPNHKLCGNDGPMWYLNYNQGRCANCNMTLGRNLVFSLGKCPSCSANSLLAKLSCGDEICCDCLAEALKWQEEPRPDFEWTEYISFLKSGNPSEGIKNLLQSLLFQQQEPSLPFPIPDLEDDWANTSDHPKWSRDPLVSAWSRIDRKLAELWQAIDECRESKCPVCKSLIA